VDDFPTAPVAAAGLIGGFAVAKYSGRRELGGGVLALAGAWCGRSWARSSGPAVAAGLGVTYAAAFGASHPLAKRIGAWPAVLTVSAATAGAAHLLADRG
jgi:hypothetical protein